MFNFKPASENIMGALSKFRTDILNDQFKFSSHANLRVTQRGISLEEIKDTVKNGNMANGKRVEGFVGGVFYRKQTAVVVYARYGDRNDLPTIVTVFRDGEDVEVDVEDLILHRVETKVETKVIVKTPTELTLEELEELIKAKKAEAAARRVTELRAQKTKLQGRIAELTKGMERLQAQLDPLHAELKALNRELGGLD